MLCALIKFAVLFVAIEILVSLQVHAYKILCVHMLVLLVVFGLDAFCGVSGFITGVLCQPTYLLHQAGVTSRLGGGRRGWGVGGSELGLLRGK